MAEAKNQKLSLEPYKGTRDFYPEDQYIQNYIFRTMRRVVERYGYEEYHASLLEESALYRAKSGEEIVNEQTYSFTDRGGRDITIRPEMTPTIARMVAKRQQELAFPLRWYSIPNLFRYERPQRGRLREHWQLNVDMFGVESIAADKEIIKIAYDIMKAMGAKDDDFKIRVNNRRDILEILEKTKEETGLRTQEDREKYMGLFDKKGKLSPSEFKAMTKERFGREIHIELPTKPGMVTQKIVESFAAQGIANVVFDNTLFRGFSYYTGMVFEVYDTNPKNPRALFGGGRYDDLLSIFDKPKVPAVGFGVGDVTMRDFLETHHLLPKHISPTQVYLCCLGETAAAYAESIAGMLRENDIAVAVDYTDRKISAQIKVALKKNIPFFICVGDDETKEKTVSLKDLELGKEQKIDMAGAIEKIKAKKRG